MDKGISIIISCCDNYEYVKECVESIFKLNINNNYEIIIVDDSHEMKIDAFYGCSNFEFLNIINNDGNKGVQYSRNRGLENAKYKYILMIDGDDKLNLDPNVLKDGNYLDLSVELLENNEDIAYTHCILNMFERFDGYTISSHVVGEDLLVKKHHVPICIIYRKKDGLDCGGYDLSIKKWQDWSFAIALINYRMKKGFKNIAHFYEKPFYLYRIHNANMQISSINVDELEMINKTVEKNKEIFVKYYGNIDLNEISELVLKSKPDRLEDLLYVAKGNIDIAKEIIEQRKYCLQTSLNIRNIP